MPSFVDVSRTALVIEVNEAEALVGAWREDHDPAARDGMPSHVTVLYPFRAKPSSSDLGLLETVVGDAAQFGYSLTSVDVFPNAVWLRPQPDDPFRTLTRVLWDAFPDCPPYGGEVPDSQPHLTIGVFDDPPQTERLRREVTTALRDRLPLRCVATDVALFTRSDHGRWERTRRFALSNVRHEQPPSPRAG